MLRSVTVSLPPLIATRTISIDAPLAARIESAIREITALDHADGNVLDALGAMLLRTESVASSKIERVEASIDDFARALHGSQANASAVAMVAATQALTTMVDEVGVTRRIDVEAITRAHGQLMAGEPSERAYAGRLRDMQNWVGGSDYSPRNALFVPPPPETIPAYLDDLVVFCNRDDLPALVQAAIAHAQFETIHPFTDGNGRIGRALINSVLRRRGVTTHIVVPLASALVAHRDRYFDLLTQYRQGDLAPLLGSFATASRLAAQESRVTAGRLADMPDEWARMTGPVRTGSAKARMLHMLLAHPVFSADQAVQTLGTTSSRTYAAIDELARAGVVRALTDRKRDQIWGASLVLDELEDLGHRITKAAADML